MIVPSISIYEVFKVVLREAGENEALQSAAAMQKGLVVDLNSSLAMNAAKFSIQYSLPMADSIIYATAKAHKCTVWTQDSDIRWRTLATASARNVWKKHYPDYANKIQPYSDTA